MREVFLKIVTYLVSWLLLILVGTAIGGIIGYQNGKANTHVADTIVITKYDTLKVVKYDTIKEKVIKDVLVYIHDTTIISDTLYANLPFTQKYYHRDSTVDVWISGYMPNLDSLNVYKRHTTQIINGEVIKYRRPKFGLEVGMGMTYIPTSSKVGGYAIAKASYNINRCSFGLFTAYHTEKIPAFGGQITYQIINPR